MRIILQSAGQFYLPEGFVGAAVQVQSSAKIWTRRLQLLDNITLIAEQLADDEVGHPENRFTSSKILRSGCTPFKDYMN